MTEIANLIANNGVSGVVVILFFWQYIEQRKTNKEREEKLYIVIETLAERIPSIEAALTRIENKISLERSNTNGG